MLIVDLSALFWWKWFASAGESRDAAYEWTVGKVVTLAADHLLVAIACDVGKCFRHELDPRYKANRPERDAAAVAQLERVKVELERRGYPLFSAAGYEADDVVASLVYWARRTEIPTPIVIAGSDKDLEQLIEGDAVVCHKVTSDEVVNGGAFFGRYGFEPPQMRDYLALVGDGSDNIKGCPGIGPVKAKALLGSFRSIAGIRKALGETSLTGQPRIEPEGLRKSLRDGAEQIDLAVQLVTLRANLDLDYAKVREAAEAPNGDGAAPVSRPVVEPTPHRAPPRDAGHPTPTTTHVIKLHPPPRDPARPMASVVAGSTAVLAALPTGDQPMTQSVARPKGPKFSVAAVTRAPDTSPHKGIIMGRSGVGKTHLVSTFPGVFLLHIEDGLKGVSPDHTPAHFGSAPKTLEEFFAALRVFALEVNGRDDKGKRPYRRLAIDSLTGIETLVHVATAEAAGVDNMEGLDYKKVWAKAEPFWLRVRTTLDGIRESGVDVWIVAHSSEVFESVGDGTTFRKWDLLLKGSNETGVHIRNFWRGWADHVFFVDWTTAPKGAKQKGKRAITKYAGRVLYTRESATHFAKNRGGLPPTLPATWEDLSRALAAASVAPEVKLREEISATIVELGDEDVALLRGELDGAKGAHALAALLSRAQGMLAVAREDAPPEAPEEQQHEQAGA